MSKQQMHGILAPHEHDVLSGRGNFVNYHVGNEHFRNLVRKHKVTYVACPKPQKGKFSRMIVEEIRQRTPPGRFLKQDASTKLWYDIGEKKALDKTRQALREGAPDLVKAGEDGSGPEEGCEDEDEESPSPPRQRSPVQQHSVPVQQVQSSQQVSIPQLAEQHKQHGNPLSLGGTTSGIYAPYENFNVLQHAVAPTPIGLNNSSHHHRNNNNNNNDLGSSLHSQHQIPQHMSPQHAMNGRTLPSPQVALASPPQFPGMPSLQQQQQQQQMNQQQLNQQQLNQQQLNQQQLNQQQLNQQQLNQQQMNQQQMNQQQMNQPQRNQQSLDQHSQHSMSRQVMPPSGMNLQGTALAQCRNMHPGGAYSGIDSLQNKLLTLSQHSAYHDQFEPRPIDRDQSQFEPRPISSSNGAIKYKPQEQEEYVEIEPERLAPLPTRTRKITSKRSMKREGSDSSLQVDTIFSAGSNNVQSSNNNVNNNLSVMSLSISEMHTSMLDPHHPAPHHQNHQQQQPQDHQQLSDLYHHPVQPEGLSSMFNTSLRFSGERRRPAKRSGSGSNELDSSVNCLTLDMSVATIGDRMSELGDMSYARMNDSQANMSFSNVFDETERDLYVNGR